MNPPQEDITIGLHTYFTDTKPLKNVEIKHRLGDFVVNELLNEAFFPHISRKPELNSYALVRIVKPYGVDTLSLIDRIVSRGFNRRRIYVIGLKDKFSIAIQHLFVPEALLDKLLSLLTWFKIKYTIIGFVNGEHLTRELSRGNAFEIRLWNLETIDPLISFFDRYSPSSLPNFFGYQRFGIHRMNHIYGKLILTKVDNKVDTSSLEDVFPKLMKGIRKVFSQRPREDIKNLSDLRKFLLNLPRHLIKFLVNAYQSYLFNLALSIRIIDGLPLNKCVYGDYYLQSPYSRRIEICRDRDGCKGIPMIPIIGYGHRFKENRLMDKYYIKIIEEEGIQPKDFYLKDIENLRFFGDFRAAKLSLSHLYAYKENKSVYIRFTLERGMYATILLRELIKPRKPKAQGF